MLTPGIRRPRARLSHPGHRVHMRQRQPVTLQPLVFHSLQILNHIKLRHPHIIALREASPACAGRWLPGCWGEA